MIKNIYFIKKERIYMLRPKEFDRGNIYLSGGMQFAEGYGTGWREIASKRLKEMQYFPLDIAVMDDHYKDRYGKLYLPSSVENHRMYKSNVRKHFIFADLNLIEEHSDALIVLYDESVRRGARELLVNVNLHIYIIFLSL